jgi:integral membrane protein (TIGR01906 family)
MKKISAILVSIIIPVLLILSFGRLMFTPLYLQFEYHRPGFPADPYGFTTEDRLKFADVSLKYLLNNEGIEFLADQEIAPGAPLYNERELSHMLDVKVLVQQMIIVWLAVICLLAAIGILAWQKNFLNLFWNSIKTGGWLTIGFIITILVAVAISFNWLFTEFHHLFFEGDTWLFLYSDSLIRLFPLPFWRDAFIVWSVLILSGSVLCIAIGKRFSEQK